MLKQIVKIKNKTSWIGFMVFNTTFSNISVVLWLSVLLLQETGGS
jgi:hypothetical protein